MNEYTLIRGIVCPICGAKNPNGYYRSHEGNQVICNKHTQEQINKWLCKPQFNIKDMVK